MLNFQDTTLLAAILVVAAGVTIASGQQWGSMLGEMALHLGCSTLGALLLLKYAGPKVDFGRIRQVLWLLALSVGIGVALALAHSSMFVIIEGGSNLKTWPRWGMAEVAGALFLSPFLTVWGRPEAWRGWRWPAVVELASNLLLTAGITWLSYQTVGEEHTGVGRPYMIMMPLLWSALRLGVRGVTLAGAVSAMVAFGSPAVAAGPSPLGGSSMADRLLFVQLCAAIFSTSGLLLAIGLARARDAAREAREKHEQLRGLADHLPGGFIFQLRAESDGTLRCLQVSASIRKVLGIEPADLEREPDMIGRLLGDRDRIEFDRAIASAMTGRAELDFLGAITRPDGLVRCVRIVAHRRQDSTGTVILDCMANDCTEQRAMQEELHLLNRTLRAVTLCRNAILHATSEESLLNEVCRLVVDSGYRLAWVGYAEHDAAHSVRPVAQMGFEEGYLETLRISWADNERGRGPTGSAIRTGLPGVVQDIQSDPAFAPWRAEALARGYASSLALQLKSDRHGILGALNIYADKPHAFGPKEIALLNDFSNDLVFGIALLRDREAYRRANEIQKRLAAAVEQASESIIVTDTEAKILYVNPAFTRMTGYSAKEVLGRNMSLLKNSSLPAAYFTGMWKQLASGEAWRGRLSNRRKDGSHIDEEVVISPVRSETGIITCYVSVQRDITEELALQAQVRQAQKMEAVGQLASGIAHDYNNILTGFLMQLGALRESPVLDAKARAELDELEVAARLAVNLTRQLLIFSRQAALEVRTIDLNELVTGLLKMLHRLIGERTVLHFQPSATPKTVEADENMLGQVIINLIVNARDAMPRGGDIRIAVGSTVLDAHTVAPARAGRFVTVTVSDQGEGMDAETLAHIFEPFFTTKPSERGTGLGLSIVRGIVAQHHGWVEVSSQIGLGSKFVLFFPEAERGSVAPPKAAKPTTHRGSECLLLVEDDAVVRQRSTSYLRVLGYRVFAAGSASEALGLWAIHHDTIRILITDMVLPGGMDGLALAGFLREGNPKLGVILTTGYCEELGRLDKMASRGIIFLPKPYAADDLGRRIREYFESTASNHLLHELRTPQNPRH